MEYKTVSPLTDSDQEELHRLIREDPSPRVRMRAEAILLSARGYSIRKISNLKGKNFITVSRWLNQWAERGIDGILEGEGRGRPKQLTEEEQALVLQWVGEPTPPRHSGEIVERIKEHFGKIVSRDTVRRLLKAGGKVWKRVRSSLAGKRDEESFRQCEQELAEHLQAAGAGEMRLLYLDESGFSGSPYIPYAWQSRGETIELPCHSGKRINVLGILSVSEGSLEVCIPDKKMTSKIVFEVLEKEAEKAALYPIPSLLVLDNASIHTAKLIEGRQEEWAKQNLFLYFIPTYSPELNVIEMLWRKIKYEWLPFHAYESFETLRSCLDDIFCGFGTKYNIVYT